MLTENRLLALLLVLGSLLIIPNLADRPLWEDEASSAVLAKNVLSFGYPAAWDGRNLIVHENTGFKFDRSFAYYLRSWLEFYVISLFFMVLGPSTFTARLPFAIFGILSIILFYRLVFRLADKKTAGLASLLMIISVAVLLHIRQCAYYSLLTFMTLLTTTLYMDLAVKKRGRAVFYFITALAALFYTHYLVFLGVFIGFVAHFLYRGISKERVKAVIFTAGILFILTAPWFFSMGILGRSLEFTQPIPFMFRLDNLARYALYINDHLFPVILIPVFLYLRKRGAPLTPLPFIIASVLLVLTFIGPFPYFRYLMGIAPFFFYYLAVIFFKIKEKHPVWAYGFFVILVATRIFNLLPLYPLKNVKFERMALPASWQANPDVGTRLSLYSAYLNKETGHFWTYLPDYAYELTHTFNGPLKGIVSFLKANSRADDIVLTNYDNCSIIFYTGLRCSGRMTKKTPWLEGHLPSYIFSPKDAVWLIPRQGRDTYFFGKFLEENNIPEGSHILQRFSLNCPDIWLDSMPDPYYHLFREPGGVPPVVIFKRPASN
ncbi:MAG: glycosyltransferase family 39 protein [Candidatus Omnitrophota bacterium]|jgi:hypothetical protein